MSTVGPQRITMIGSVPPQKGLSAYCRRLATALATRDDVDLDLVAFRSLYPAWLYPGGSPDVREKRSGQIAGARVHRTLEWWNPAGWLREGARLRGDIVHAQWWSFFLAPAYLVVLACARLRGKRVVITVHNVNPHEGGWLPRLANRAVMPLAHRIVVHTDACRRALIDDGVDHRRIRVVAHGVPEQAEITRNEAASARARRGVPPGAPTVLFFGNIRPYKGLPLLIDAFARALEKVPEARLLVAGQPWGDTDEIRKHVRALRIDNNVVLSLTFADDQAMRAWFAVADVVVYPYTHFEAQSGAACDALRYGRAIVVTDVGGLPELASDARAIVPPLDAGRLATAIIDLLTDSELRARLEAGAREKARRMSWDAVAAATVDVYAEMRLSRVEKIPVERLSGGTAASMRPPSAEVSAKEGTQWP